MRAKVRTEGLIAVCIGGLAVSLSCVWGVGRDVPAGLLCVAHFDQYPAASWAEGTRTPPFVFQRLPLCDGKFGRALALGRNDRFIIVGDDGNFRPTQGAIQMWIRPNTDGDDGRVWSVLSIRVEPKNYLNINKLSNGRLGTATGSAGVGPYRRIDADVSHWKAGEWHHVAVSWGNGRLAFFLDGELVGEATKSIAPKRVVPQIVVGASFDGAIDELAIWGVPKRSFITTRPISSADLGEPEWPKPGPPPLGDVDRYRVALPKTERGYVVVTKHFVDEVDPRASVRDISARPRLSTFAAAGEYQSIGLVVYATYDMREIEVRASALRRQDGQSIPASDVSIFLNRRALQRKAPRTPKDAVMPVAALLDPYQPFDLPAGYFKEITITIRVPREAGPGRYTGSVEICPKGRDAMQIPLLLRVLPFRLEPSNRKQFGMYYELNLSEAARERVCLELQDLRDHGVTNLYSYLSIRYKKQGNEIVPSYDELDEGLALLRRFGFNGTIIIRTGFTQLAGLLGHKEIERHAGAKPIDDERFTRLAVKALRGLAPLKAKYADMRIAVTHMDEVLGAKRLPLYISLTKPVRQAPSERMYITLHTMPRPWVPEATRRLDPYVDIRCYNGHALDLWIQAGHTFDELRQKLEQSGDEGWVYYNPHRPFFIAKWARIVNGLFLWWSPLKVHCPYRYRTMRGYPYSFIHNMGFSVTWAQDGKTPVATRQWEGFRLGVQDVWYTCMLEDLVGKAKASAQDTASCKAAERWLEHLRGLMPKTPEIQGIKNESPVVFKVAERLDGAAFENIRRTTAEHIVKMQQVLKEKQ